ncbi:ABC transporter ATP-binding protein [Streptomyces sp. SID9727]|uniref:ABC transporter ATP-binding protein n=1 Tax=Streptomyces sp. SID9727 TaxID=2706114 RepID=UPI0013C82FB5|nr:ABC transporter ATP-binding protein [Streptomyces sp. SID9727]NEC68447.1 ABC transporter ATP-binding protein [Streptomyces sp. SID9727]
MAERTRPAERIRRRRTAAGQLLTLARSAGTPVVLGTCVLHLVAGALPVVFVVCVGLALQRLSGGGGVSTPLAVAVGAFFVQQILIPVQGVASQSIARRVDAYCTARLMRSAGTGISLRALERPETADAARDAGEALSNRTLTPGAAVEGALALIARYTQLAGAVLVAAIATGPLVAVAGLAVALICRLGQTAAFVRWGQHVRSFSRARRRLAYLRDLAVGTRAAKEIRLLGLVDWLDRRYAAESVGLLGPLWAWRRRVYGRPFVLYTLLGLVCAVGGLLALAMDPGLRVGALSMGLQVLVMCVRFGVVFPESDVKMIYGRSAWESLLTFERLGAASDTALPTAPRGTGVGCPEGDIVFHDVRFGYEPGRPVLNGLDLTIAAGASTAVVGVNGAGKSTLVKLLTGLYEPGGGRITCGGVDLAEIDRRQWQRSLSVMFQDFTRYELSLRDNVAMGAIGRRDDDAGIAAELDRVGLGGLADALPAGLDTPLGQSVTGGVDLSGGQWQRVALARSLFAVRHGARVLVLDEPTAQLDARGEADFYETFLELTKGTTSIVISHRFSTVRLADRIVTIGDGRVREGGTHDELVAAGNEYAAMFEVQARRFAPVGGAE